MFGLYLVIWIVVAALLLGFAMVEVIWWWCDRHPVEGP